MWKEFTKTIPRFSIEIVASWRFMVLAASNTGSVSVSFWMIIPIPRDVCFKRMFFPVITTNGLASQRFRLFKTQFFVKDMAGKHAFYWMKAEYNRDIVS